MAGSSSTTGKKSTMKQTAGKAATIKSPAKPAKKAVKRPSRRQTGPNEWVMLYLGGSAIGEIGVFPSGRKRTINYSVGPAAVAKEKKSAGKDVAADTENNESAGVVAETIPASANEVQMFVHVTQGKEHQQLPLTSEQFAQFSDFKCEFDGLNGIMIDTFVPGSSVVGYAHERVYFLSPRSDSAYAAPTYRLLCEQLGAQHLAAFGRFFHGKGWAYVAIMSVKNGLVMLQLPLADETHLMEEMVTPKVWESAEVSNDAREAMAALIRRRTAPNGMERDSLIDPLRAFMADLAQEARAVGAVPDVSSTVTAATLVEAINNGEKDAATRAPKSGVAAEVNAQKADKTKKAAAKKAAKKSTGSDKK